MNCTRQCIDGLRVGTRQCLDGLCGVGNDVVVALWWDAFLIFDFGRGAVDAGAGLTVLRVVWRIVCTLRVLVSNGGTSALVCRPLENFFVGVPCSQTGGEIQP